MSSDDVENSIRNNIVWSKLPDDLRVILGGSQREYDKRILDYSIRNQLRYKENIVRFVKKSEEEYYENLLMYSQTKMMIYPYHLSDIVVRGLRVTPFTYYSNMMTEVMQAEKSYDSLPNFTAADAMRILGIGRNQYIDLMNISRANKKLFRRSKSIRETLPQKPASTFCIEPWYLLCYGCILENDIKMLTFVEKELIDRLVDFGPMKCGLLDKAVVVCLINRGLVYLDVPIKNDDYIYVPTLDGFVMNRIQGDYFETLLYKIFVTIDGQTTVKELAETIGIDSILVKNAVSVFCRLGFAKKRVTGLENCTLQKSWTEPNHQSNINMSSPVNDLPITITTDPTELTDSFSAGLDDDEELVTSVENLLAEDNLVLPNLLTPSAGAESFSKRVAFLFDSTLTAFLMMGNLSSSLKNHAVTLFEVGKLNDEAVDSFIDELQNVNFFVEGEAHRYSEHAKTLLHTIQSLRISNELDLIRGESLWNLDENARTRVMQKSYRLLVSMAPMNAEACSLPSSIVPHLGTPTVETVSAWFRLSLYEKVKSGPSSMFLPMGCRLLRLPSLFWKSRRLMVTQSAHEPIILTIENSLLAINESLQCSPVFIQSYSEVVTDSEIVNVPFSFKDCEELENQKSFYNHPAVKELREAFQLDVLCGYIVLLKLYNCSTCPPLDDSSLSDLQDTINDSPKGYGANFEDNENLYITNAINCNSSVAKDPRKICSNRMFLSEGENFSDYVLLDCVFGIPLFDDNLNKIVCQRIFQNNLLTLESAENINFAVQTIVNSTKTFINQFQDEILSNPFPGTKSEGIPYPTNAILFDSSTHKCFADIDAF